MQLVIDERCVNLNKKLLKLYSANKNGVRNVENWTFVFFTVEIEGFICNLNGSISILNKKTV